MDEEDEEWKRLMEEKLLHAAEQSCGASDQMEGGDAPNNTTVMTTIDPVTGRPVQVTRHVSRVMIPGDQVPEEVVSIIRSMQSNLESGRPSLPGGPGLASKAIASSQVSYRRLDKDGRIVEERVSAPFHMPFMQLIPKRKKGKQWPLPRLRANTRDSDDEESASEAEDIIPKESRHDEQYMQLKCVTSNLTTCRKWHLFCNLTRTS